MPFTSWLRISGLSIAAASSSGVMDASSSSGSDVPTNSFCPASIKRLAGSAISPRLLATVAMARSPAAPSTAVGRSSFIGPRFGSPRRIPVRSKYELECRA